MYPVIETRLIKVWSGTTWNKNVCLVKGKEATWHTDGYYPVIKGNMLGRSRIKL